MGTAHNLGPTCFHPSWQRGARANTVPVLPVRWNITPTAVLPLCPCPSCFPLCKLALMKSALSARNKIVSKMVSVPNPRVFPWGVQTLRVLSHCSPLWLCLGTGALLFHSQGLQYLGAGFLSCFFCFSAEPRAACGFSVPRPGIDLSHVYELFKK